MKLPWQDSSRQELKERIEDLRNRLRKAEESRDSWKKRYEAEEERRAGLAREKQEAEKKIKKLEQKLESNSDNPIETEDSSKIEMEALKFEEGLNLLEKLSTVESNEEDMLTVKFLGDVRDLEDFRGLKNVTSQNLLDQLYGLENMVVFHDGSTVSVGLGSRPFFEEGWSLSPSFSTDGLLEFIESNKTWVVISAGRTRILEEDTGEFTVLEEVKSRVDRRHSQGGFSQSRFERKREKQIQEHVEEVEERLEAEEFYVIGNRQMASELGGTYLGGYDSNRELRDELYKFRLARFH